MDSKEASGMSAIAGTKLKGNPGRKKFPAEAKPVGRKENHI